MAQLEAEWRVSSHLPARSLSPPERTPPSMTTNGQRKMTLHPLVLPNQYEREQNRAELVQLSHAQTYTDKRTAGRPAVSEAGRGADYLSKG